jgi:hypothetical protein
MSQISSSNWSETANSNNAATPDGWPEGQAPSTVNNCAREMMSALKIDWNERNPTVTSGGSANVHTLTYTTAPTAYVQGHTFAFIAGFTNTGTATLNVNGLGAKNIFMDGAALAGGEIVASSVIQVMYDGTQFQITSSRALSALPIRGQNLLVNGDGEVWQRGAAGSASIALAASTPGYTADRWVLTNGANQAMTISQQAGLTNGSRYCIRVQRNSGQTGTGAITFEQPLTFDQVYPLRGQIITISCKARSGANWSPTSGAFTMALTTGTTATEVRNAALTSSATAATVTSNLGTSSAVTTVTATSAAVVSTSATQGSFVFSFTPVGTASTNDYLELDEIQLEIGGKATTFDRRLFADELARCERFFAKSFPYATAPAQATSGTPGTLIVVLPTGASGTFNGMVHLPTRMRTSPSLTTYNHVSSNANWRDLTNSADRTVSTLTVGENNFSLSGASGVAGAINLIHWSADADI